MRKIISEKTLYHKYAFVFDFANEDLQFCREVKDSFPRGTMSFYEGKWRFNDMSLAWMIKNQFQDTEIEDKIVPLMMKWKIEKAKENVKIELAEEIKTKTESSIEKIKGLKLPLYEFQKLGVEFFDNNDGNAILADQMGCGKTAQSLAYAVHKNFEKVLIICPASVKYNWSSETTKWTHFKPLVLSSTMIKKDSDRSEVFNEISKHNVIIINYDSLKKFMPVLTTTRFDLLICDEVHYIKTITALRTKFVKEIAKWIPRRLLLSGTPMLSRPSELFTALQIMDPKTWNNWFHYARTYCAGHQTRFGYDTSGASNIDDLRTKINRYFLRRVKEDVLKDLPPKQFTDIPVELGNESRFEYDLVMNDFVEYLSKIKKKNNKEIDRSMAAEALVSMNELRQITTKGKMDATIELIQNIVSSGEKVLVFSNFNEPLERLHEKFEKESLIITGKTDEFLRQKIVEDFQKNPEKKIFLGGMKSAGVGITLTAASNVIFMDYSYVPADHTQAMDRAHRIGNKAESINVYQLYAMDTIDQHMREILEEKQAVFDKLFSRTEVGDSAPSSLFNDLLERLQKTI